MIRVSPAARYKEEWCFIPNVENVEVGVSLGQFAVDGWQSWENDFIAFILGKKNDICACLQRKAAAERAPAASWCICYGWSLPCTILINLLINLWRNLVPLLLLWLSFWPSVVLSIPLPRAVWMRLWRSRPVKTVGAEHEQTRHVNHVWCITFREGIAQ